MNTLGSIMTSEIASTPQVFRNIKAEIAQFESIRNLISEKKIRSVLVLARGTSDNAAHFLKYLIEVKMGLPVGLTSPSSISIYNSELHYEGVLVIAISQSGQSPDLVQFAEAAKKASATLISITNDSASPLARLADHHFALHAGPELAVAATKSYSAQLLISYLLVSTWTNSQYHLDKIIEQSQALVDNANLVNAAVAAAQRENECVVLGRGFAYANARETALKVQETAKISVQGLSTADYLHGPISALTPDTQLFILAPSHLPAASISEAVARIRKVVPRIFWIGNGGTPEGDDIVIAGSNCGDEVRSSIVDAVSLQSFALEFAKKSGFDPDAPVGLTKVTLTH
jgi:glucosamine--fructose-6-phosphate aminotransferase (isomerizing)